MRTREDVEDLKRGWARDPIFDIETTESFEDYHDELLQFSTEMKEKWAQQRIIRLLSKAEELGGAGEHQTSRLCAGPGAQDRADARGAGGPVFQFIQASIPTLGRVVDR